MSIARQNEPDMLPKRSRKILIPNRTISSQRLDSTEYIRTLDKASDWLLAKFRRGREYLYRKILT